MSIVGEKIVMPVSIRDVKVKLGSGSADLGTLCTHPSINKWAKYKPIRMDGQRPTWFSKNKQASFGLELPFCTFDVMNQRAYKMMTGEDAGWVYLKPRGDRTAYPHGEKEYYRLTDFVPYPNDDDDPKYDPENPDWDKVEGYNHAATLPFWAEFPESEGMKLTYSSVNGYTVECNRQATRYLVVNIRSNQEDLALQDFIDTDNEPDSQDSIVWRPVLQFFYDGWEDNDQNTGRWEHWYEREWADYEKSGDKIMPDRTSAPSVRIDLTDEYFEPYLDGGMILNMCIGIGKCDKNDPIRYESNNDALFLLPYNESELPQKNYRFYFRVKLTSHFPRPSQLTWIYCSNQVDYIGGSSCTVLAGASGTFNIAFTVKKAALQALHFVGRDKEPDAGYTKMTIMAHEVISNPNGSTTERDIGYLTPVVRVDSYTIDNHAYVPAGDPNESVTLYATVSGANIGNIQAGCYGSWYFYGSVNDIPQHGNDWMMACSIGKKTNYF